jgi:hypothetical protein
MSQRYLLYIVNSSLWIDFVKWLLEINLYQKRENFKSNHSWGIIYPLNYHSYFV